MSQSPEPREERERDEYMRSRSPEPNRERSSSNTAIGDKGANSRKRSPPRPSHAPTNPDPTTMVGVFGLSVRTTERDLEEEFGQIAPIEKVIIVFDARSQRSRGFGFVTMKDLDGAAAVIKALNGLELHGRRIRVDYSVTNKPHEPTPGEYRGEPNRQDHHRGPPGRGMGNFRPPPPHGWGPPPPWADPRGGPPPYGYGPPRGGGFYPPHPPPGAWGRGPPGGGWGGPRGGMDRRDGGDRDRRRGGGGGGGGRGGPEDDNWRRRERSRSPVRRRDRNDSRSPPRRSRDDEDMPPRRRNDD